MKRVCLLTGASGVLGRAFIERHAAEYQIVAVHHETPIDFATQDQIFVDPLRPTDDIPANDHAVYSVRADLCRADGISAVVAGALDAFGRVDLLINAAARRHWAPLLEPASGIPPESILNLNVLVPLRLTVEVAHQFWTKDPTDNLSHQRNVVNISSTAGLFVYPDLGQALYAASKAALNHLTYHLASELWDIGIRVNAVAPDTFPGRVPTNDVLDAVVAFDSSQRTGDITSIMAATP